MNSVLYRIDPEEAIYGAPDEFPMRRKRNIPDREEKPQDVARRYENDII